MPARKTAWVCSHGHAYSEAELDAGMSFATMDYLMEQDRLRYELEADRAHELALARAFIEEPDDQPWPWYADDPFIVQHPQVFYA